MLPVCHSDQYRAPRSGKPGLAARGGTGYTSRAWRDVVTLLNAGQFRPGFLVTHRYPLADWEQAIASLRGAESPRGKVLLEVR